MRARNTVPRAARSIAALAAAALCSGVAAARAQSRGDLESSYGAVKLIAGAGGQVEIAGDAAVLEHDLLPSWGAGAAYMARVHRHFAIGAQLAFQSWQSSHGEERGRDRNLVIDGAAVPAGVLPIDHELELYLAAGLGFSMSELGDVNAALDVTRVAASSDVPLELDQAIHFVLLPVLGVRFALGRDAGVLAELGYALRWYEHELRAWVDPGRGATVDRAIELSLGQFTLGVGAFF